MAWILIDILFIILFSLFIYHFFYLIIYLLQSTVVIDYTLTTGNS